MDPTSCNGNRRGVSLFSSSTGYTRMKEPSDPEDRLVSKARKIRRGKSAAVKVYNTPEIRLAIFSLLGRNTLAGLMRLEKSAVESVSAVLYRRIPVSLVTKMSRAKGRRTKYCNAVQIIDRNGPPRFADPAARYLVRPAPPKPKKPIPFDEVALDKDLDKWRKKFPQLHTVLYKFPSNPADDAYVVRIIDDEVVVELESHIDIIVPDFGDELLPPKPDWPGIEFRHTIALRLVIDEESVLEGYGLLADREDMDEMEAWLYSPNLDRRVTSIDHSQVYRDVLRTINESMDFITSRKVNKCEPFSSFTLMDQDDGEGNPVIDADYLRQITAALGPQLRTLQLGGSVLEGFDDLQVVIDIIDETLPFLKKLVLLADPTPAPLTGADALVLFGLPNLQILEFTNHFNSNPPDVDNLSKVVYQLGSHDCVFHCHGVYSVKAMKDFNELVHGHKICPLIPMVRTQEFGQIGPFPWYIPKSEVPAWNRSESPASP